MVRSPDGLCRGQQRHGRRSDRDLRPVLSIIPYEDEDQAVKIANDTEYGLAAAISSGDPARAKRLAGRLRAGQVRVNNASAPAGIPFGGYKQSGNGREQGEMGMHDYLETKAIIGFSV